MITAISNKKSLPIILSDSRSGRSDRIVEKAEATQTRRAGAPRNLDRLLTIDEGNIGFAFDNALWQEVLELGRVLAEKPLALFFDDLHALLFEIRDLLVLAHLATALLFEHQPSSLDQLLDLALVLLDLHATLSLVHLLDAVVLRELGEQLRPQLLLFVALHPHLLLLRSHLLLVRPKHLRAVLIALLLSLSLLFTELRFVLLMVELIAQVLELFGFLALGLHLTDHGKEDALLLLLDALLLRLDPLLTL